MQDTREYPTGRRGLKPRYLKNALGAKVYVNPGVEEVLRQRFTLAEVNAGLTFLPAVPKYGYRVVDAECTAVGGAAAAGTTVDLLGVSGGSARKIVAWAQANLTQSTKLRAGATGAAVLADGASLTRNDINTGLSIGKTGSSFTTATHFDVVVRYVLET